MAERLSDNGYMALGVEVTKGTSVIPSVYLPLMAETVRTQINMNSAGFIFGNKAARWKSVMGMRKHVGTIEVLATPGTVGYFFNMLLQKGNTTGSDPYTNPYTLGDSVFSYTVDFLKGQIVKRFVGLEAKSVGIAFEDELMKLVVEVAARKQVSTLEVSATPTGTNPTTVILKTGYDPSPTDGLVVGDYMRLHLADGTTIDFEVNTIPSGTTITTNTNLTSGAAADTISLRSREPSDADFDDTDLNNPFTFARSEYVFGADAAAALSATHTAIEQGSGIWTVLHAITPDDGANRSGSNDPAVLPRGQGDVTISLKTFFDTPEDWNRFLRMTKRALVCRHYSNDDAHELRLTINDVRAEDFDDPIEISGLIYQEFNHRAHYDALDDQMFDVKVISSVDMPISASASPSVSPSLSPSISPSISPSPSPSLSPSISPSVSPS